MIQDISLGLLHSYKEKINSYDEVLDQNGEIKPYWKKGKIRKVRRRTQPAKGIGKSAHGM